VGLDDRHDAVTYFAQFEQLGADAVSARSL
jgi:hypothetical protein